jgi:hypothetical protein
MKVFVVAEIARAEPVAWDKRSVTPYARFVIIGGYTSVEDVYEKDVLVQELGFWITTGMK